MASLLLTIGADIAQLKGQMDEATRQIDKFGATAKTIGTAIAGAWAAAGVASDVPSATPSTANEHDRSNPVEKAAKIEAVLMQFGRLGPRVVNRPDARKASKTPVQVTKAPAQTAR